MKEVSRPVPYVDKKKRNLIKISQTVYDKVSSWKVKEFIIKNCEIIEDKRDES